VPNAQWIGLPGDDSTNTWMAFRKEISVEGDRPRDAVLGIACDSRYWLWHNGECVVRQGQLNRGPTPDGTYAESVPLRLVPGTNTIAVLVQYFGRSGFSHHSSGKAALVARLEADGVSVVTDASWRVRRCREFGTTDPPLNNYRLPEPNLRVDARQEVLGWQGGGFDDSAWERATELGAPPAAPWGTLYSSPIHPWKDFGVRPYDNQPTLPLVASGEPIVCELPYNCQVSPTIKVRAEAGRVIGLESDVRRLYGAIPTQESHRHEYVTRDGVQEFELPAWLNGHEVVYSVPSGVEVLDLGYRETGYNAEFAGSFRCDDERLNRLWEKARRTLYVTMRHSYMDCPDRERALWWGDAVNELGEAFYVFDARRGPLLARKCIYELARWRRPDGVLHSPIPAGVPRDWRHPSDQQDGAWGIELPQQMLASISSYGFWTYHMGADDPRTIRDVYPAVREYLSLWELDERGLVKHRRGDWDWADWGENIDVAVLDNAWYALALKGAIEMAPLAGADADVAGYRQRLDRLDAAFDAVFWREGAYRSPEYRGPTDDRASAMAVVAGLAPRERYEAIARVLSEQRHASPYLEKYALEALMLIGRSDLALRRMRERYSGMIDQELTTLWEVFGEAGQGGGTYNHGWSGGPLTVLSQYVAGVSPTSPGFKTFAVRPQLGDLRHVESAVDTPYGLIEVTIDRPIGDDGWTIRITVPRGTTAEVGPAACDAPSGRRLTVARVGDGSAKRVEGPVVELRSGEWLVSVRPPSGA
jgi:hypothetical protein